MKIYSRHLTASADDRTITGTLLPFDEDGYTNLGRVRASKGTLTLPDTPITLNLEHQASQPLGTSICLEETDTDLRATFTVLTTRAGDDALTEIAAGVRSALSVEIEDPVIRSGKLVAGRLVEAALVATPAFPSAKLAASEQPLAEDTEPTDPPQKENTMPEPTPLPSGSTLEATRAEKHDAEWLFATLAGATTNDRMTAALQDVTPASILGIERPQYEGELWDGRAHERKIIPLFNHRELTSFEIQAWRWTTKPEVSKYAGNNTEIPTNEVKTEQVKKTATRIAGGHKIDRKHRDFSDAEFFRAYFAAMTESYSKTSDLLALQEITDAATVVQLGATPANNPDIAKGFLAVLDGAISILNETDAVAQFAVVSPTLWREMLTTPKNMALEYLSSALGIEKGALDRFKLIPSAMLDEGDVLVGVKEAATIHELGGQPIRVDAIDVSHGAYDEGVFGYQAVNIHSAGGLALVKTKGD